MKEESKGGRAINLTKSIEKRHKSPKNREKKFKPKDEPIAKVTMAPSNQPVVKSRPAGSGGASMRLGGGSAGGAGVGPSRGSSNGEGSGFWNNSYEEVHTEGTYVPVSLPLTKTIIQTRHEKMTIKDEDDDEEEEQKMDITGDAEELEVDLVSAQSDRINLTKWFEEAQSYVWPAEVTESTTDQPPLIFMQLPSHFPITPEQAVSTMKERGLEVSNSDVVDLSGVVPNQPSLTQKNSVSKLFNATADHTIKNLPDGQIGRLVFYKSGKVKMCVGGLTLDLSPGATFNFDQQLLSISPESKECFSLGRLEKRVICSLDVESLGTRPAYHPPEPPSEL